VQHGPSGTARAARRLLTIAAVVAANLFLAFAVAAQTVSVAGQDVVLTLPKGSCAFDSLHGSDFAVLHQLERLHRGRNTLLLAYGTCTSIERARKGKGKPVIEGQFLAPHDGQAGPRIFGEDARADVIREVAAALPKIPWTDVARTTDDELRQNGGTLLSDVKALGVLHQDSESVFFGVLLSGAGPDGKMQTVVGVVGTTIVNKVMITLNAYRTYTGESSVRALLQEHRRTMQSFIAANDRASTSPASAASGYGTGLDWHEIGISAAIGGAIFIGLLLAWTLFQRLRDAV
jgi:hypothetical protein